MVFAARDAAIMMKLAKKPSMVKAQVPAFGRPWRLMAHNTMETARSIDEDLHVRCAESADTAFRAGPPSSLILIFNTSLSLQPFLGSKLQKIYFYGSLVPI
jgi:hypothetical protein